MKKLSKKLSGFTEGRYVEVILMCAGMAMLVLFAVFIIAPQSPLKSLTTTIPGTTQTASWLSCWLYNNCNGSYVTGTNNLIEADPTTIASGGTSVLTWVSYRYSTGGGLTYHEPMCLRDTDPYYDTHKVCSIDQGIGYVGYYDPYPGNAAALCNTTGAPVNGCHYANISVSPSQTTTYTFCNTGEVEALGCSSVTVFVTGGGGGVGNCSTAIETPWNSDGFLLYAGSSRRLVRGGYNYCLVNDSSKHYFFGGRTIDTPPSGTASYSNIGELDSWWYASHQVYHPEKQVTWQ